MTDRQSCFFDDDTTPAGGRRIACTLDADELADAARRLKLPAVKAISGHGRVSRAQGGLFLEATVSADLVRQCVVSLQPMDETIEESFAIRFLPGFDDDGDDNAQGDALVGADMLNPDETDIEPLGDLPPPGRCDPGPGTDD